MAVMEPPNLFYRGSSMRGTFKPGDKLIIEKAPFNQIKKGDLIIFGRNGDEENDFIVHRVAAIAARGLVTRGDNCSDNDRDLATEENIVGRVIQYDRQGNIQKVRNSRLGVLRAAMLHGRLQAIRWIKSLFKKPYLRMRKTGLLARIWRPELDVLHFETSDGPLVKYVHKGETVATCLTAKDYCWIKRPYDFIIKLN